MQGYTRTVWSLCIFIITNATPIMQQKAPSVNLWEEVDKSCFSSACDEALNLKHLRRLEANMEPTIDPCVDFYQYACGNWGREHINGTTMMRLADIQITDNYVQLFERWLREKRRSNTQRKTIEKVGESGPQQVEHTGFSYELVDADGDQPKEQNVLTEKMLQYYAVCKERGQQGKLQLQGYMQEMIARGWWHRTTKWWQTLAQLGRYGFAEHFLHLDVKQTNATYYFLRLVPHGSADKLEINSEVYEILSTYTRHSKSLLTARFRQIEQDLEQILSMACVGKPRDEDDDCELVEQLSLAELSQHVAEVDWLSYIELLTGRAMRQHDLLMVKDLSSIRKIVRYINHTDEELIFLYNLARCLTLLQQEPHAIVVKGPGSASCLRHMRKIFYTPMTYLYERAYYSPMRVESEAVVRKVFESLRSQFADTLRKNKMQLSSETLQFLLKKLAAIRLNVGNLPLNVTQDFYLDLVTGLKVGDNFYQNHLNALQHAYDQMRSFAQLSIGVDSSPYHTFHYHWPRFPDNVDATPYYFCLNNMIVTPHAYLQLPFYDHRFWPALLYGDLANTLGHEMIHAFDNYFMLFDHAGNIAQVYRDIEGNAHYRRNVHCLDTRPDFMCERIADHSGTRLALDTFMQQGEFRHRNGKLFFLQFAQFFCNAANASTHAAEDPLHESGSKRLNDTLAHMPEFAEVFSCPLGSPMNPVKKCEMW